MSDANCKIKSKITENNPITVVKQVTLFGNTQKVPVEQLKYIDQIKKDHTSQSDDAGESFDYERAYKDNSNEIFPQYTHF